MCRGECEGGKDDTLGSLWRESHFIVDIILPKLPCDMFYHLPETSLSAIMNYHAALYREAHNNKFMHGFLHAAWLCVHDKHANWTIIKPNTEKNINSHIVLPLGSLLLWASSGGLCWSQMKEAKFQFAIRSHSSERECEAWEYMIPNHFRKC